MVQLNLSSQLSIVYFEKHNLHFVISLYCYDGSINDRENNPHQIRLSFDQSDAKGNVLKDGKTFEFELDIDDWIDVAQTQTDDADLIEQFLAGLSASDKSWFTNEYQATGEKLAQS